MRDISKEITSYQSAKDVAKALNIKPVTLKKYSLLIEKISKGKMLRLSATWIDQGYIPL